MTAASYYDVEDGRIGRLKLFKAKGISIVLGLLSLLMIFYLSAKNDESRILWSMWNSNAAIVQPSPPRGPLPIVPATRTNDVLILYSYHESENSRENIKFFMKHALHATSDFIFILNGPTDIDEHPGFKDRLDRKNIEIVKRMDTCFDLGAYGAVLNLKEGELLKKYQKYIFIDSTARGPFVPSWSSDCWTNFFTNKLDDKVKLVGSTMNCKTIRVGIDATGEPKEDELFGGFIDSMIMATDNIGVQLLAKNIFSKCSETEKEHGYLESLISREMYNAGFYEDYLMTAFHTMNNYAVTCNHESVNLDNHYYSINIHPYEVIFIKASTGINPLALETYSKWVEAMKYSSYNFCVHGRTDKNGWHRLMNWGKEWPLAPPLL